MTPRTTVSQRPSRVGELLRHCLAEILLNRVADPRLKDLTITDVSMSPDLKQARVAYLVREGVDAGEMKSALSRARGFIRQEVAKAHILRVMPEITFVPDQRLDKAQRLAELFDQVRRESSESSE
jgi:ribosome-binding factor A